MGVEFERHHRWIQSMMEDLICGSSFEKPEHVPVKFCGLDFGYIPPTMIVDGTIKNIPQRGGMHLWDNGVWKFLGECSLSDIEVVTVKEKEVSENKFQKYYGDWCKENTKSESKKKYDSESWESRSIYIGRVMPLIDRSPSNLQYIPVNLRFEELCDRAIYRDYSSIVFVPSFAPFYERAVIKAIKNKDLGYASDMFKYIEDQTENMVLALLKKIYNECGKDGSGDCCGRNATYFMKYIEPKFFEGCVEEKKEMTIEEIEKKLGFSIKIVKGE